MTVWTIIVKDNDNSIEPSPAQYCVVDWPNDPIIGQLWTVEVEDDPIVLLTRPSRQPLLWTLLLDSYWPRPIDPVIIIIVEYCVDDPVIELLTQASPDNWLLLLVNPDIGQTQWPRTSVIVLMTDYWWPIVIDPVGIIIVARPSDPVDAVLTVIVDSIDWPSSGYCDQLVEGQYCYWQTNYYW